MKNTSLKLKIFSVGLIPLLCFMAAMGFHVWGDYQAYQETNALDSKVEAIAAISSLVHQVQIERGKSSSFLAGGTKSSVVKNQRDVTDREIKVLERELADSAFDKEVLQDVAGNLERIQEIRKKIDGGEANEKFVVEEYTDIVADLLAYEEKEGEKTNITSISQKFMTWRILEGAKESGGQLRANLAAILSKDAPIPDAVFFNLLDLKGGVEESLKSNALVLDNKSDKLIQKFKNAPQWKMANTTFQNVLLNAKKGGFYQNPKDVFATLTEALNILDELVVLQRENTLSTVEEVKESSFKNFLVMTLVTAVVLLVVALLVYILGESTTKKINGVAKKLGIGSEAVASSSESMASISSQLSEGATQQASALQETSSSIDEISSMVQRSADSARSSIAVSEASTSAANEGKLKVETMIRAIRDISQGNDEIAKEIARSNKDISKIVEVIEEIGDKTKVINDIVFQTKLLSFNASVEAARAGEQGKGFAVVAEEVGSLAAMSGQAALEITEMLESSIDKVRQTVDVSKSKMEALMVKGGEKVKHGVATAEGCGKSLEEILTNVESVNAAIREIAGACEEQSKGIHEITTAIQQLDQVSHQNSSAASEASSSASDLKNQSTELKKAVVELQELVGGKRGVSGVKGERAGNTSALRKNIVDLKSNGVLKSQAYSDERMAAGSDVFYPDQSDNRFEDL